MSFQDDYINQEDSSWTVRVSSYLKRQTFSLYHQILGEDALSTLFPNLLLIFINTCQFLYFFFHEEYADCWGNSEAASQTKSALGYFLLVPYLQKGGESLYIALFYVLAVHWVIILSFVLLGSSAENKSANKLFYSPFLCRSVNKTSVLKFFPASPCYSGTNLPMMIIGFLGLAATIGFGLINSLLNFEPRFRTNSYSGRYSGVPQTTFLVFQTVFCFCTEFVEPRHGTDVICALIALFFSVRQFTELKLRIFYVNSTIFKVHLLVTVTFLWTSFILILGKVLSGSSFKGSYFLFWVGLVLLSLTIMLDRRVRYDLVLLNTNNFENADIAFVHLHYVISMLLKSFEEKSVGMIFDGYIEYHKTFCLKLGCPSRKKWVKDANMKKIFKEDHENEHFIQIVHLLNVIYIVAFQKFPHDCMLRIQYSWFLTDVFKQKQNAVNELIKAEGECPNFIEEFLIYHLKLTLEKDLINEQRQSMQSEFFNEIYYTSLSKGLRNQIDKASAFSIEFWSLLSEDLPDLEKVAQTGYRLNRIFESIESIWLKLEQQNLILPPLIRLYSGFVKSLLFDKAESQRLLNLIKAVKTNKNFAIASEGDLSNDAIPTIVMSISEGSFGVMTNLNSSASALLGYSKLDLINKKVNMIMPEIFSQHHDQFIRNYLATQEARVLNKDRVVISKSKLCYINPICLKVKQYSSLNASMQFVATWRMEKTFKHTAFVLIKAEGEIDSISSTCINILGFDQKTLLKRKLSISDIVPEFFDKLEIITGKHGCPCKVHIQRQEFDSSMGYFTTGTVQIKDSGESDRVENLVEMTVHASEINFKNMPQQGYLVRICPLDIDSAASDNRVSGKTGEENRFFESLSQRGGVDANKQVPNSRQMRQFFSLRFDISNGKYVGELKEVPASDSLNSYQEDPNFHSILNTEEGHENSIFAMSSQRHDDSRVLKKFEDSMLSEERAHGRPEGLDLPKGEFGAGIKTMRLWGSRVVDLEDLKKELEVDDEEEEQENEAIISSTARQQKSDERRLNGRKDLKVVFSEPENQEKEVSEANEEIQAGSNSINTILRSRKNLNSYIREPKFLNLRGITVIKFSIIACILILIGLSVGLFIIEENEFDDFLSQAKMVHHTKERHSIFKKCIFEFTNMIIYSQGVYDVNETPDYPKNKENIIREELKRLDLLRARIENDQSFVSAKNSELMTKNIIPLYHKEGSEEKVIHYNLNEAIDQISTAVFNLLNNNNEPMDFNNTKFYFLHRNILNDLGVKMKESEGYFASSINEIIDSTHTYLIMICVAPVPVLLLSLVLIYLSYLVMKNNQQANILYLLEIKTKEIKEMIGSCENFANKNALGNEEDNGFSDDEELIANFEDDDEREESHHHGLHSRQKGRRKFKYQTGGTKIFCLKILLCFVLWELYFFINILITDSNTAIIKDLSHELRLVNDYEGDISFVYISLLFMIWDENLVVRGKPVSQYMSENLDNELTAYKELEREFSFNMAMHEGEYNDYFNMIMFSDSCRLFFVPVYNLDLPKCIYVADGVAAEGLILLVQNSAEIVKEIYSLILEMKTNSSVHPHHDGDFKFISNITGNPERDRFLNNYNSEPMRFLEMINSIYVPLAARSITEHFLQSIDAQHNRVGTIHIILFVSFISLLILSYASFWYPLQRSLARELYSSRNLMLLIPLSIYQTTKTLKEKIKSDVRRNFF